MIHLYTAAAGFFLDRASIYHFQSNVHDRAVVVYTGAARQLIWISGSSHFDEMQLYHTTAGKDDRECVCVCVLACFSESIFIVFDVHTSNNSD